MTTPWERIPWQQRNDLLIRATVQPAVRFMRIEAAGGLTLVVGALVADNLRVDAPSGVVRAFDVRTGNLRWAWDPVPPDWKFEKGDRGRFFQTGTPNVWSILSGDEERGIVYVPTGNAAPDIYGGDRQGLDGGAARGGSGAGAGGPVGHGICAGDAADVTHA